MSSYRCFSHLIVDVRNLRDQNLIDSVDVPKFQSSYRRCKEFKLVNVRADLTYQQFQSSYRRCKEFKLQISVRRQAYREFQSSYRRCKEFKPESCITSPVSSGFQSSYRRCKEFKDFVYNFFCSFCQVSVILS